MPRPLLALFLLILSFAGGCATTQVLPQASFYGLTIQTVQPDPKKDDLELKLGLDFQVKNPLGIKLIVPRHQFSLLVGGQRLGGSGTRQEYEVPKKGKKVVRYDFTFDLSQKTLGEALGAESTFAFEAEADVDLPSHVLRTFDLDKTAIGGELGEIAKTVGGAIEEAAKKSKKGKGWKLKFAHEGRIKLPRMPKLLPPDGGDKPKVELVAGAGGGQALGDVGEWMEPIADLLDAVSGGTQSHEVRLPVADLLVSLGVPRNKAQTAITAINTALSLTGGSRVASSDSTVPVRFNLDVGKVLEGLQPQARRDMTRFLDGWRRSRTAFAALGGGFALPEGVAFSVPFRVNNPNQFAMVAPSFRFGLVDGDGTPIALVQMLPEGAKTGKTPEGGAVMAIGAGKTLPMQLHSQVNWSALGLAGRAAPDLRLAGEFSVDLGLGPLTVPFSFALPPPAGSAARESRTEPERTPPAPRDEERSSSGSRKSEPEPARSSGGKDKKGDADKGKGGATDKDKKGGGKGK